MNHRKFIISNTMLWEVLSIREDRYQRAKRGVIEKYLNGIRDDNWFIDYTNYHVTVKHKNESFNRIFVLTEQDAKEILFT